MNSKENTIVSQLSQFYKHMNISWRYTPCNKHLNYKITIIIKETLKNNNYGNKQKVKYNFTK